MTWAADEARRVIAEKDAAKILEGPKHWTGQELMAADIKPPHFVIPGMMPEGLAIIVSPSKVGKSFMVSALSLAICQGGVALGHVPTNQCEVIYLDLEQNTSKAKSRWKQVLGDEPMPSGIHLYFEWKPTDRGGIGMIERALDKFPRVGIVFVDVFTKIKPTATPKGMNAYDQEYQILGELKKIADQRHMAIALVHHTNRTKSEDPLDTISGTTAMSATPDATWILSRSRGKTIGKLYVTGRAANESLFNLMWNPSVGSWTIYSKEE